MGKALLVPKASEKTPSLYNARLRMTLAPVDLISPLAKCVLSVELRSAVASVLNALLIDVTAVLDKFYGAAPVRVWT